MDFEAIRAEMAERVAMMLAVLGVIMVWLSYRKSASRHDKEEEKFWHDFETTKHRPVKRHK